jgi:hypothetical protein
MHRTAILDRRPSACRKTGPDLGYPLGQRGEARAGRAAPTTRSGPSAEGAGFEPRWGYATARRPRRRTRHRSCRRAVTTSGVVYQRVTGNTLPMVDQVSWQSYSLAAARPVSRPRLSRLGRPTSTARTGSATRSGRFDELYVDKFRDRACCLRCRYGHRRIAAASAANVHQPLALHYPWGVMSH